MHQTPPWQSHRRTHIPICRICKGSNGRRVTRKFLNYCCRVRQSSSVRALGWLKLLVIGISIIALCLSSQGMEASAQPWVFRALGLKRKSLCFLDGFKISCPYPYFKCYSWKTSMLFIHILSSQGKLQDGPQEKGNYGLQLINGHLPGLQSLGRWRVSQGCSFTSNINIAAWSLTSAFRFLCKSFERKEIFCLWDGGAWRGSWEEEQDERLQVESSKTWFSPFSECLEEEYSWELWACPCSGNVHFQRAQLCLWSLCRKAGGGHAPSCKRQVWAPRWQLASAPLTAAQASPPWHLPAKLLEPQQRLRLCHGADVGAGLLLASRTALPAAGKSNHWQR